MVKVVDALFDGKVFHPLEPITLEPNTQVKLQVEFVPNDKRIIKSFLRTARSLSLDGPPDWSENLDNYLYDDDSDSE